MLRRAHIVGLLLAAVAVPALAADFIVNGNVKVGNPDTGSTGSLTVNGIIMLPKDPAAGTPACNPNTFGQVGTGLYPYWSSTEQDAVLWFCGVKHVNGQLLAQRYVLGMDFWPESPAPLPAVARSDAALAARVATLEKQVTALKAMACRGHESEAACK